MRNHNSFVSWLHLVKVDSGNMAFLIELRSAVTFLFDALHKHWRMYRCMDVSELMHLK
uniref:Histidine--tRNA ligase n=1 Tax=Parascaris univalens TaxID=6257 RepID=A0A914ZGZ9_PARUN